MSRRRLRCLPLAIGAAALVLFANRQLANAQGMLPGGASIKFEFLLINEDGGELVQPSDDFAEDRYFNLAHCVCSAGMAGKEQSFSYQIRLVQGTTPVNRPAEIWVGEQCDNEVQRPMTCSRIDSAGIADMQSLVANPAFPNISIYQYLNPKGGACQEREISRRVWLLADGDGDAVLDYFPSVEKKRTDTQPPPIASNFKASGAEGAVQLEWTVPTARAPDIVAYQALCAKADGTPALAKPSHAPRYQTVRNLCGLESDPMITKVDVEGGTTEILETPTGIAQLDSNFICGELANNGSSLRIEGLQNGEEYTIALVAIDLADNPAGVIFSKSLTPQPVTDFWEDLKSRGSKVEGGYCLAAQTYGDGSSLTNMLRGFRDGTLARSSFGRWLTASYYRYGAGLAEAASGSLALRIVFAILLFPLVVLALGWHLLGLPLLLAMLALLIFRRRIAALVRQRKLTRGVKLVVTSTAALICTTVSVTVAKAQSSNRAYWEDDLADEADLDADIVRWHIGLRLGPYTPQIDDQFREQGGQGPAPYQAMFGRKYSILPQLDIERVIWSNFGQVTVGGSFGYLGKKARAFTAESDPMSATRERSPGDSNSFRLLPISANVSYRFSYLDDTWGVPLVPYARAGLAYYVWWVSAPNGDAAKFMGDKGAGASLGVVGSLGIALRAERIDDDAARSMRDSGINHAGFYAEVTAAKVDGFGSDQKLQVGDTTWFAGINFEF